MATAKIISIPQHRLREAENRLLDRLRRSPSGCWEWSGHTDKDGYGSLTLWGRPYRAHRLAFFLFRGSFEARCCICHRCDNPRCCNPTHLFLGSDLDNARDRDHKDRGPRGQRNHFAKTTPEMVRRIRAMLAAGKTQKATARELGITRAIVQNIAIGRAWSHLA